MEYDNNMNWPTAIALIVMTVIAFAAVAGPAILMVIAQ